MWVPVDVGGPHNQVSLQPVIYVGYMKGNSWRKLDDEAKHMRRYLPESHPHTRNLANELARVWGEDS